jgi:5-methyltetrahydropteroyltriglutamate--homocysteine methyltransferase
MTVDQQGAAMQYPAKTTAVSTVLGYPRIGRDRALKKATEAYWRGRLDAEQLLARAAEIRQETWISLREAGIDQVPCNDFSFYDQVLDTAVLVGAIAARHQSAASSDADSLDRYFAMARGSATTAPLEMTKWFDTNYHYLVPEVGPGTRFALDPRKPLGELAEAHALGLDARPVLVGPVTLLLLSKATDDAPVGFDPICLLDELLAVYAELLDVLRAADAEWVQFDEPALVADQPASVLEAVGRAYESLGGIESRPKILVASYFGTLGDALPVLRNAPVDGLALDFTAAGAENLDQLAATGGLPGKRLVAGVVDGRNVWVNDLQRSLSTLGVLLGLADEVAVAPSCSLLHVPLDLDAEPDLDPQIRRWLAFARQKVTETVTLARGLGAGADAVRGQLTANLADLVSRSESPAIRNPLVRARLAQVSPSDSIRDVGYSDRTKLQAERLELPLFPTTTIGSFPQTPALREARAMLRQGRLSASDYEAAMRSEIAHVVALQEEIGLDVLVHGEPERNDMVQYFAEQLLGVLSTRKGWVQSYGTRYVRPPIIAGDISRPTPMTVRWFRYAQSLTSLPMKAMLTGPVTMLCWSFVRDDQPWADTVRQMALAIRDEVRDLESAGAAVIQVDEPALREGLPLRRAARRDYLDTATDAFRLATSAVRSDTQIHTHMCYAEFGDVIDAIANLDADVISLEAARSRMAIVDELAAANYPAAVGPGVYDIHSPRVPSQAEIEALLHAALVKLPAARLWVNPDCGLTPRTEPEVVSALRNLVAAARVVRTG